MSKREKVQESFSRKSTSNEPVILAYDVALLEKAGKIATESVEDEKFLFYVNYDINQKDFLFLLLKELNVVVDANDMDNATLAVHLNISQLYFIRDLDCVIRVSNGPKDLEAQQIHNQRKVFSLVSNAGLEPYNNKPCTSNNAPENAQLLSVGSSVSGNICCPLCYQWFRINISKTGTYTIYTTGKLDTTGTLYDQNLHGIARNSCYEEVGDLNFRISRELNANTTYYIRVGARKNQTGAYTLNFVRGIPVYAVKLTNSDIVLDKDTTYELPISPQVFANLPNTKQLKNINLHFIPENATEQRVTWGTYDLRPYDAVEITSGWYNGQRYQTIKAKKKGTLKLRASDWLETGNAGECNATVDARNKVLVKQDGEYNKIVFYNGKLESKVWLCTNADIIMNAQNVHFSNDKRIEILTRLYKNTYTTVEFIENQFFQCSGLKEYTPEEMRLIYAIDPLGFSNFVHIYSLAERNNGHRPSLEEMVAFKDSVYTILFKTKPIYYYRDGNSEFQEVEHKEDFSITEMMSESELIFATHTLFDHSTFLDMFASIIAVLTLPVTIASGGKLKVPEFYETLLKMLNTQLSIWDSEIKQDFQQYVDALAKYEGLDLESHIEDNISAHFSLSWVKDLFSVSQSFEKLYETLSAKPSYTPRIFQYFCKDENFRIFFEYKNGTIEEVNEISQKLSTLSN